jgi:predicted RNase H-like HicB family nuclease
MNHRTLTAVLTPESEGYVSLCPELDIASQGDSVDEALSNLKEAVEAFYEAASPDEITGRLSKPSLVTHIEVAYA